jgi:hypothetical protein
VSIKDGETRKETHAKMPSRQSETAEPNKDGFYLDLTESLGIKIATRAGKAEHWEK